jgi:quercetin dioxygenase-like cupin family protein
MLLKDGTIVEPSAIAGGASIQILEGRLRLQADGSEITAIPGDLVVMAQNLREPVRAEENAAVLISVAWPPGAGAWEQEERQGKH